MLKFATARILPGAHLGGQIAPRTAHRAVFEYEPREGYLYVRSRAISSRCNENFDEFPASEIKTSFRTFIGKPVFVNHVNDDHRRARGVITDAALHEDRSPDGAPDTWVEVLMEIDAHRFPKLAKAILDGHIDRTSMGCDVAHSICSACGNKATTPAEYCSHIPRAKGQHLYRHTASGQRVSELIRETCYGLSFFENSVLVEPPADPTAHFLGVDSRGLDKNASLDTLAYGETKAPADVDTLREDACPVCGDDSTYDGQECRVCGFISPPAQFRDPDLDAAKRMDLRKQVVDPSLIDDNGELTETGDGTGAAADGQQDGQQAPGEANPEQDPTDPAAPAEEQLFDPNMLGPDGEMLGEQPLDSSAPGVTDLNGDGIIQPGEILPDGAIQDPEQGGQAGPRELPWHAQDHTGDPFTQGPDMPDGPLEPEGPGQQLMDEGLGGGEQQGGAQPGTPGDGVPDVLCPSCGFSADATPPSSQDMGNPMSGADGVVAGDVCPNCTQAQLLSPGELMGANSTPPPVMPHFRP